MQNVLQSVYRDGSFEYNMQSELYHSVIVRFLIINKNTIPFKCSIQNTDISAAVTIRLLDGCYEHPTIPSQTNIQNVIMIFFFTILYIGYSEVFKQKNHTVCLSNS